MKIEVIREEPSPPPIKEIILKLTPNEIKFLKDLIRQGAFSYHQGSNLGIFASKILNEFTIKGLY